MRVLQEPLTDKAQTVQRIFELARQFSGDLDTVYAQLNSQTVPLSALTLIEYFDMVRRIPYRRDDEPVEVVARPRVILQNFLHGIGKDCKKAAVLIGAYLENKRVPWRLAVVSTRPDKEMHHIFPQGDIYLTGDFVNLDATYSYMKPFSVKHVTDAEIYEPGASYPLR